MLTHICAIALLDAPFYLFFETLHYFQVLAWLLRGEMLFELSKPGA